MDEIYARRMREISTTAAMSDDQKRVAAGKFTHETARRFKDEGKTIAEIAELIGIRESRIRELLGGMSRKRLIEFLQTQDLSVSDEYKIEGPWAFRNLDEIKTPIYIYVQGKTQQIGEVTVKIGKGMKFEVEIQEGYEDFDAVFEVPMRFVVRGKK